MKELSCAVVQDLLPMYTEDLTQNETTELIQAHLKHCQACRACHEAYRKDISLPIPPPSKRERKLVRAMRLRMVWYLFWPLLYAVSLQFDLRGVPIFMGFALMAVLMVMGSHNAMYIYDLDDTKKEFYEREARNIQEGNGSFFLQALIWAVPILLPCLLAFFSWAVNSVK